MLNQTRLQALKSFNLAQFGHVPQLAQAPVHASSASVIIISGGEGSGKSKTTSAEIAARFGTWRRVLFVCYQAESATNESDYLVELLGKIGAIASYSKPKGGNVEITTRDGAVVESVTTYSKNEQAVTGTGKNYDIIAMLEAGKQSYAVFLACLMRISRTGGLLILSGTIERSQPWFADIIQRLQGPNQLGAQVVIIPTWENRTLYPEGRNDPKIKAIESEIDCDLFNERFGGVPCVPAALVFKKFSFLSHVYPQIEYDDQKPVEVWIDPGYSGSHYAVEFVQFHPRAETRQKLPELPDVPLLDVWVVDELYLTHAIHEEVIAAAKAKPIWSSVKTGVGDVVMSTHPMAGRAPIDVWYEKTGLLLRGKLIEVEDNIDRQCTFLKDPASGSPRLFFNPRCKGATGEYGRWKRKEIGENLYGEAEKTNCDALKAIGYGLIDNFGFVDVEPVKHEFVPQLPAMRRMLQEAHR